MVAAKFKLSKARCIVVCRKSLPHSQLMLAVDACLGNPSQFLPSCSEVLKESGWLLKGEASKVNTEESSLHPRWRFKIVREEICCLPMALASAQKAEPFRRILRARCRIGWVAYRHVDSVVFNMIFDIAYGSRCCLWESLVNNVVLFRQQVAKLKIEDGV